MRTIFGRIVTAAALLLAWQPSLWAQLASLTRNAPLHRDASTKSPAIEHLQQGERLMLVETAPKNGLYHVRTEDERVGWVWSRFVTITQSPHTPGQPTIPQVPLAADAGCDPDLWKHVYHPHRLIVVHSCIAVTGVIVDATAGREPNGVQGLPEPDLDSARRLPRAPRWNLRSGHLPRAMDGDPSRLEHLADSLKSVWARRSISRTSPITGRSRAAL